MPVSVLDAEIKKYLPLLGTDEKNTLLTLIKSFLSLKNSNADNSFIQEYNKDIDDAMKRIDTGSFVTHEDLRKEMKTW